jgi:hypothetical protein
MSLHGLCLHNWNGVGSDVRKVEKMLRYLEQRALEM